MSNSIVQGFAARLRRDIALGELEPGARLNIEALKRAHKVSHPSIREALALLAGEGFVSAEDNKGYRVLDFSLDDLLDATRLRSELECMGLTWSIEKTNLDWRAHVVAAHHALSEVEVEVLTDPVAFANEWDERNRLFHLALIGNCGSPRLIDTVSNYYDITRRYRLMAFTKTKSDHRAWLSGSRHEHKELAKLALAGDAEAASGILRSHITKNTRQAQAIVLEFAAENRRV